MASLRHCLLAATIVAVVAVAAADESSTWHSRSGHFRVGYASDLQPVVINRMHSWVLDVVDPDGKPVTGATLTVSGGMPIHDHGLPTSPRVTRELEPGRYLLEGMRFHMRGEWQVEVAIEAGELSDVVVIVLHL